MAEAGDSDKLKVFVSYSRRDASAFAEELVAGLELAGFAPFLDRHDIVAGEDWEARLNGLIEHADTVVYIVSPESVRSERCEWEVNTALEKTKRILPVLFAPVPEADIPEQLRRRQFVRFDTGQSVTRPLAQLAEALRQNLDWIREHTRIGELSARWNARGRAESLLLRGDDLSAAQVWAASRSPNAPAITDLMLAFIAASKEVGSGTVCQIQCRTAPHHPHAIAAHCVTRRCYYRAHRLDQSILHPRTVALVHGDPSLQGHRRSTQGAQCRRRAGAQARRRLLRMREGSGMPGDDLDPAGTIHDGIAA